MCGLKWSPNKEYLASGGNDNQLLIWSLRKNEPVQTHTEHNAAVKALAWSPHNHGVLVSGGGTADRSLRFWNTLTGQAMQTVETGSQVCNVAWSKHSSELVSTHGYSFNQVVLWKYPTMQPIVKLTGHHYRVLYLVSVHAKGFNLSRLCRPMESRLSLEPATRHCASGTCFPRLLTTEAIVLL